MIKIRRDYPVSTNFRDLVEFFNKLEKSLEYPNCEGYTDEKRVLQNAEQELIKWGKL